MKKQMIKAKEILEALCIDADKFYVITIYPDRIVFQGRNEDNKETDEICQKNNYYRSTSKGWTEYTKDGIEFVLTD